MSDNEHPNTPALKLVTWVGTIALVLIGFIATLRWCFHSDSDSAKHASRTGTEEREFSYLKNIWSKPPNPVGGTWRINVTYHDDNLIVFNHPQTTERIKGVESGSLRINLGFNSSGIVGYTINLNSRDGTWSQKYIEEGGTLRVTDNQGDKIFVDQLWRGELLNKFVLTK